MFRVHLHFTSFYDYCIVNILTHCLIFHFSVISNHLTLRSTIPTLLSYKNTLNLWFYDSIKDTRVTRVSFYVSKQTCKSVNNPTFSGIYIKSVYILSFKY